MTRFLGLLQKDARLSFKSYLVPLLITYGTYFIIFGLILFDWIKSGMGFDFIIDSGIAGMIPSNGLILAEFFLHKAYVAYPAFWTILFIISLSQNMLNYEQRTKCEIFYRTQPINIFEKTGSKYLVSIVGHLLLLFASLLLHYFTVNIGLSIFGFKVYWWISFVSMLQIYCKFAILGIFLGSLSFLCSSIFKNKAFLWGFVVISGISLISVFMNLYFKLNIPILLVELGKFVFSELQSFTHFASIKGGISSQGIERLINENWLTVMNMANLWKIIASGIMYIAATYIYKFREVK